MAFTKSIKKNLLSVDLFGKTLMFEKNDLQTHNTLSGVAMTFTIIAVTLGFGFLFGKEIYERKIPNVVRSTERLDYSRVELREFPILIAYVNYRGIPYDLDDFANNTIFHQSIETSTFDETLTLSSYYEFGELTRNCGSEQFHPKYKDLIDNYYAKTGYRDRVMCFPTNQGIYFQNAFGQANSTHVLLTIQTCLNSEAPKNKPCLDDLQRSRFNEQTFISIATWDAYIDSNNYTHPVQYTPNVRTQQVNNQVSKANYVNVEKGKVRTDAGWLLANETEYDYLTINIIDKDIYSNQDGMLLRMYINSDVLGTRDRRSYMKVQELLARLGGVFNALALVVRILMSNYVEYDFYASIFNYFHENEKKRNDLDLVVQMAITEKLANEKETNSHNGLNNSEVKMINNNPESINNRGVAALKNNYTSNNANVSNKVREMNVNKIKDNNNEEGERVDDNNSNDNSNKNEVLKKEEKIRNLEKPDEINRKSDHVITEEMKIGNKNANFLVYLCRDVICCKSSESHKIAVAKKLLCFNNMINVGLNEYIRE